MAAGEFEYKNRLRYEFSQFKEIRSMLHQLQLETEDFQPAKHRNQHSRPDNQFGRWLMALQFIDGQQMDERFPLLPRELADSSESRAEFVKYFRQSYKNMTVSQAEELRDKLLASIEKFLSLQSQDGDQQPSDEDEVDVQYKEIGDCGRIEVRGADKKHNFCTPTCKRVKDLVDMCGELPTALVCLRYHSLDLFKGGESSISAAACDVLYKLGKVKYEGFASPLNCQLLDKPDAKFCSQFLDTDSAFGSLGNFFSVDLMKHQGGWTLNPPFVEHILESMAMRVVSHLDEAERPGEYWFFIFFPHWTDCKGWKILDESQWKLGRHDFQPHQLGFQDCYGARHLSQLTTICLFAMGELPNSVNLGRICDELKMRH